jgi:hypothetical protein
LAETREPSKEFKASQTQLTAEAREFRAPSEPSEGTRGLFREFKASQMQLTAEAREFKVTSEPSVGVQGPKVPLEPSAGAHVSKVLSVVKALNHKVKLLKQALKVIQQVDKEV